MNKNCKITNDNDPTLGPSCFYAILYITFVVLFQIFDFTIDYGFSSIWVKDELAVFKTTRRDLIYIPAFIASVLYLFFIISKIFDGEIRVFFQIFIVGIFVIGMFSMLIEGILVYSMFSLLILLKISAFILFFCFLFIKSVIDETLGEE